MQDFTLLVAAQREYFFSQATKPYEFRMKQLRLLQQWIGHNEAAILRALNEDLDKSPYEGYLTEVCMVKQELKDALGHLKSWMRPKHAKTAVGQFPGRCRIYSEPYGVTLIMSPWNYPFQLTIAPLIGAVCAGNCAVIKPSAYSPATSALVARMAQELFPAEYVAVVQGGRQENAGLLEQAFDFIFFTGSPSVGRLVMEKASAHLTPVSLELGGKSPVIVDETADIALTARRLAWGKYLNAGQTCVAPDYVLVQERVKPALLEKLKEWAVRLQGTDPLHSPDLAHIVNFRHFRRLQVLRDGSPVYCGGGELEESLAMELTVLTPRSWEEPVMQQEIFGPLLPVLGYETLEEVIALLQKKPEPLALYLFTNDRETQRRVMEHLRFGGGCVNDTIMHVATNRIGFGGVGESGMGSYHGLSSFEAFTHA